jgi:dipeptidyl-peptidase 4
VVFLRSSAGDDPVHALWVLDLPAGETRCVADPRSLEVDDTDLPPEERARRERAREQGSGVVSYTTDRSVARAAFTLGGRLFTAHLTNGGVEELGVPGPVVGPVIDPTGTRVAYVRDNALCVATVADGTVRTLLAEEDPAVSWGLAEFVAAEEMGRLRGFWWAPDGSRLLAARVDVSMVTSWHITDPAEPASAPTVLRYPAAGTANADVGLALVDLSGRRVDVSWDSEAHPYLTAAEWTETGPVITVQSRDQRELRTQEVDPETGATTTIGRSTDAAWVELLGGLPRRLDDGRLVSAVDDRDTRRLAVDGVSVSPAGLQLRRLIGVADGTAVITASATDPTVVDVWCVPLDGGTAERLTDGGAVHDGAAAADVTVLIRRCLEADGTTVRVEHPGGAVAVASFAETPALQPRVELLRLGDRALAAALLLPHDHDGPLPVLVDPYGGPHAQRVQRARSAWDVSQWFADQGFAVVVADGRGTPGRGPSFERAVHGDLAAPVLRGSGRRAGGARRAPTPGSTSTGWPSEAGPSAGTWPRLPCCADPTVFHAAVAGAPVTDWRLYDTHYTERYLGHPPPIPTRTPLRPHGRGRVAHPTPAVGARPRRRQRRRRPHPQAVPGPARSGTPPRGPAPVGRHPHDPQEEVAENLLILQLDFLAPRALGPPPRRRRGRRRGCRYRTGLRGGPTRSRAATAAGRVAAGAGHRGAPTGGRRVRRSRRSQLHARALTVTAARQCEPWRIPCPSPRRWRSS